MEKRTSGGTPAATQNAPFQSSARISLPSVPAATPASTISVIGEIPHSICSGRSFAYVSLNAPPVALHGLPGIFSIRVPERISESRPFMHSEDIFFLVNIPLLSGGILSA
jgi:hypothetical protein